MFRTASFLFSPLGLHFLNAERSEFCLILFKRWFTHQPDRLRFQFASNLPSFSRCRSDFTPKQQRIFCWKCGAELNSDDERINCSLCGTIQPLHNEANFFSYLGFPLTFNLDHDELGRKFRKKQSIVHPDKFVMKSEDELQHSQQHSMFLNDAYRTLRDPFKRATYLLRIIEKLEEDFNETLVSEFEKADNDLVAQVMDLNEEIEMLENPKEIRQKMEEIDAKIDDYLASMSQLLHKKDVKEARKKLQWIKFLRQSRHLLEKKCNKNDNLGN